MLWLHFMRDFYRTGNPAAVKHSKCPPALRSAIATVVFAPVAASNTPRPYQAVDVAVHLQAEPVTATLTSYLQRLSVDGEHAFGVWNEEAGFSLFSANFERVTGLSSGECAGHDWIHTVHPQQQYNINEALLGAVQGHHGRCLVQSRRDESESWRWLFVDIKAPARKDADVMVMFRDISEQKALEEALNETQAALALSDRGRTAFLSSMSHELRTPLNAIMGFAEMMKEGVLGPVNNPTYQEYVTHIHDSGANLLNKISALLDIASMDAGSLDLTEEEFCLSDLLAELGEIHSHTAFARGQRLAIDCAPSFHLQADRAKLLCATSHLVSNALRHSADSAVIELCVRVQPGDSLVISVRDAGEGILPKQLGAIRQALNADVAYVNVEPGGIGLGLSLAKELVARHGGRMTVDSIRKRGTVSALLLPLDRVTRGLARKRPIEIGNLRLVD